MKLIFDVHNCHLGKKTYQVLVPRFSLEKTYVGEFGIDKFMIMANSDNLRKLAALQLLIGQQKNTIIYLQTRINGLPEYLKNWFWDSKVNDILLLNHSRQFDVNEWKELRQLLKKKGSQVIYNIDEEEFNDLGLEDFHRFRFRENKDFILIKRKYETIFFIGSFKVFKVMSNVFLSLAKDGENYFRRNGGHDHFHMDMYLSKKDCEFCIDYYDEELWDE